MTINAQHTKKVAGENKYDEQSAEQQDYHRLICRTLRVSTAAARKKHTHTHSIHKVLQPL